jgi:hypothetical protein
MVAQGVERGSNCALVQVERLAVIGVEAPIDRLERRRRHVWEHEAASSFKRRSMAPQE